MHETWSMLSPLSRLLPSSGTQMNCCIWSARKTWTQQLESSTYPSLTAPQEITEARYRLPVSAEWHPSLRQSRRGEDRQNKPAWAEHRQPFPYRLWKGSPSTGSSANASRKPTFDYLRGTQRQ